MTTCDCCGRAACNGVCFDSDFDVTDFAPVVATVATTEQVAA